MLIFWKLWNQSGEKREEKGTKGTPEKRVVFLVYNFSLGGD